LKSNTSFGLGPSSSYAGKLRSPHVNAVNIKKNERKMSKNEHVTIVVVVLQYRLVEIEGKIAVVIFLHTNVQIEAMEDMAG